MGVLNRRDRERNNVVYTNLVPGVGDDTFQVDDDASLDHILTPPTHQRTSQATLKKSRAPHPESYIKNTGRKARGCKNSRRYENSVFLSDLIEPGDDRFDDLDITDFMVKSVSAFEMLFEDESQMNRWSEFVNMNGEEQDRYLQELACVSIGKCSSESQSISGNKFCDSDLKNAAKCFQNVDSRIKRTLKSRNVSMDGLKFFEEEILSFFIHIDGAVLISLIPSSMDRLLIHGICQYMNLTSSSFLRLVIQVENKRNQFQLPAIPLSQYLQRVR